MIEVDLALGQQDLSVQLERGDLTEPSPYLQLSSDVLFSCQDSGRLLETNHAWAELLQWPSEATLGHSLSEFVSPVSWSSISEFMLKRNPRIQSLPVEFRKRDGELLQFQLLGMFSNQNERFYAQTK